MKTLPRIACVLFCFCSISPVLHAQVPQLINYQGRVVVGTTNFNGTGQFKFALVNTDGTATYWSNNNSSVNGSEPSGPNAVVTLTVTNGLYSVLLGDNSGMIPGMTSAIPSSVFTNSDVRLRVWFNDGTHNSQLLTPDQRIAATGYAMMSSTVPDGSITGAKIANGTITSANIANGAVGTAQLGTGAVTGANIANGAVGTAQLGSGAVTNANIGSGAVGTAQLASGAVTTANIANGAVGTAQLGSGAVTNANIGFGAVGTSQLQAGLNLGGTTTGIFSGNGANLTNLNAANITGTLPALNGSNLTSLNASNLSSGTIANSLTSGTSAGTPNTLVLLDGSGNFTAGTIGANAINLPATTSATNGVIQMGGFRMISAFGNSNVFLGTGAGNFTLTGSQNMAAGFSSLRSLTSGIGNTATGTASLGNNTTGFNNTASGYQALIFNTTASNNVATGQAALYSNSTGSNNVAVGTSSLRSNNGSSNTAIGTSALINNFSGANNIALGNNAGITIGTGSNNIDIGSDAAAAAESNTIRIGTAGTHTATFIAGTVNGTFSGDGSALTNINASTATNFSGSLVGDVTGTQGATVVSLVDGVTAANVASGAMLANAATNANTASAIVKRDASNNFSAGTITASLNGNASSATTATTATSATTAGSATNFTGNLVGNVTGTQGATIVSFVGTANAAIVANGATLANANIRTPGTNNIVLGQPNVSLSLSGQQNTGVGSRVMETMTTGDFNAGVGYAALFTNSGSHNTGMGYETLYSNTGDSNTATGYQAMLNNGGGSFNTATGSGALTSNTMGANNTAMGLNALFNNATGSSNTAMGFNALLNATGSFNIAIGRDAGGSITTGSNNIDIGNNGVTGESNTIRIGTAGVHTATNLAGTVNITGDGGAAKIQAATAGKGSYMEFDDSSGNSPRGLIGADGNGFSGATNQFTIGTWTNNPLGFYTNQARRMTIDATGKVGIGTATPGSLLDVQGSANFAGGVGVGLAGATHATLEINPGGGSVTYSNGTGFAQGSVTLASGLNGTNSTAAAIYASGNVITTGSFIAISDERVKNIIGRSDAARDLDTLLGIEITDYRYKDVIAHGDAPFKKVIAQQVEKVFPQAVNKQTGEVPDIYKLATIKDGWIALATDLKRGERVKLIADEAQGVYEVLEVRGGAFRTDFKSATGKVFVYGREVKDFRNVDYDAIAMLNVSATQEMQREIEDLKANLLWQDKQFTELKQQQETELAALCSENATLRAENSTNAKRLTTLEARDKERDVQLARIEESVAPPRTVALQASGSEQ